jgi:hypothetical protein
VIWPEAIRPRLFIRAGASRRHQLVDALGGIILQSGEDAGQPSLRIDAVEPAVSISI